MILQSLNDYYGKLSKENKVPDIGFSYERVRFLFILNNDGKLLQIVPLLSEEGGKERSRLLEIPYTNEVNVRASNIQPNYLVDKAAYVLGIDQETKPDRLKESHNAYKKLFLDVTKDIEDNGAEAVRLFLENPQQAQALPNFEEIIKENTGFIAFRLDGELRFIHERPAVRNAWINYLVNRSENRENYFATCLVTGDKGKIQRLHAQFKGIRGGQTSGKSLVSFNKTAFASYGKESSFNAPVGVKAEFRSSTALKYLIRNDRQKVQIREDTIVFWAERETPLENYLESIWGGGNKFDDLTDESGYVKDIRDFLEAARDGKKLPKVDDPDIKFYILGLSPNAARLSVRFWHVSTVEDVSYKIGQHFKDLSIVRSFDNDLEYPAIWQLLKETAVQRETKNVSPVLAGAMMRSILTGAAYPQSLLAAVIARIRAGQTVNYLRASIIKACLNRKYRISKISMEVNMALNKEETNTAYCLGRLFAALEKAQQDAIPGANTTIKDRYYGSASATPRSVFPQLLRLAQHHIQKAEYGRITDRIIEDIMQGIDAFPAHLSLDEQGLFAIGYYHQRRDLYTKNTEKKEE